MNLEQLEASLIRTAQRDLGPSPSDRERHQAELLARLQGAPPWSSGGARSARGEGGPAGALGLGGAVWKTPEALGGSRLGLLGVGLLVGVVLGGVLGFGLGRGWFGVSDTAAVNVASVNVAAVELAAVELAAGERDPFGNLRVGANAAGVPRQSGEAEAGEVPVPAVPVSGSTSESVSDLSAPSAEARAAGGAVAPAGHAARRERRVAVAPKVESSLAMELSMLQRARRALNADNGRLALGIVMDLDERFPKGVLIEERNATRVLSLCMLNRAEEARRFGRRFLERHPASVYAERVRQSCIVDPLE